MHITHKFPLGMLLIAFAIIPIRANAADINLKYKGSEVKVTRNVKDSVEIQTDGAHVSIVSQFVAHKLTIKMEGRSDDGQLILKTAGKAKVKLEGLQLTSAEGAPIWLKNKKKVEVEAEKGTDNTLTIEACIDTANHKPAVIFAKDKLKLSGEGTLRLIAQGDGCKGIRAKDNVEIEGLTLDIATLGDNLGEDPNGFGGFGGPPMGGGMPMFDPENLPEEVKAQMEEMRKRFEAMRDSLQAQRGDSLQRGAFPGFPGGFNGPMGGFGGPMMGARPQSERGDSLQRSASAGFPRGFNGPMGGFGGPMMGARPQSERGDSLQRYAAAGFPGGFNGPMGGFNEEDGGPGMGPMKRNYLGTAKGIKSQGKVIVNSGSVTVKTSSAGAEGIEGKQGVELNGGTVSVNAVDDAINANERIIFNGANVTAISTTNDAVDANYGTGFPFFFGQNNQEEKADDAAIIITGGSVFAWSQRGAPEEGLDCDFAPIAISGGRVFSVGAGMGEMPSVPTEQTATQPTVLLIGLPVTADEPISIYDAQDKVIDTITVPFAMRGSSSVVSHPDFKAGATYSVKTKGYERQFTIAEQFSIVR